MDKITFKNGSQPALNDVNLNQLQTNMENAVNKLGEEVNDKFTGVNLYENESGTNDNTINLSESCENFKFIEIQYKLISSYTPYYSSRRIHEPNGKETCLDILTTLAGGDQLLIGTILIAFDGAVATTRRNYTFLGATKGSEKEMFITKIIGYK